MIVGILVVIRLLYAFHEDVTVISFVGEPKTKKFAQLRGVYMASLHGFKVGLVHWRLSVDGRQ